MHREFFGYALALTMVANSLSAQLARPPALPGEITPPAMGEETSKTDVFVTGIRIAEEFEDNALSDNRNKQSNLMSLVEPELGWKLSHPRIDWNLSYQPGLVRSHPLQAYNSRSQLLDASMRLRLSKRFAMRLRNSFLESKNPFDRLRQPELASGFGILDRPNDSILVPTARKMSEQAGVDLTYALGPHTIAGVSGSFFNVKYGAAAGNAGAPQYFDNTSSRNGHGFYSHHLTRRTWIGFDYNVQKLMFSGTGSQTLIHSVFYTHAFSLTPSMRISMFAGPERSTTHVVSPLLTAGAGIEAGRFSNWTWAGGATYEWARARTSLMATTFHKVSDGGGVLGAVKLSSATLEFHRQFTGRWTVELAASYDYNRPLTGNLRALSYASASGGVTRMLGQNLSLDVRYGRVWQAGSGTLAYSADHNRVSTSLAYDFSFPLGR
jgi:hypothetical protein